MSTRIFNLLIDHARNACFNLQSDPTIQKRAMCSYEGPGARKSTDTSQRELTLKMGN